MKKVLVLIGLLLLSTKTKAEPIYSLEGADLKVSETVISEKVVALKELRLLKSDLIEARNKCNDKIAKWQEIKANLNAEIDELNILINEALSLGVFDEPITEPYLEAKLPTDLTFAGVK